MGVRARLGIGGWPVGAGRSPNERGRLAASLQLDHNGRGDAGCPELSSLKPHPCLPSRLSPPGFRSATGAAVRGRYLEEHVMHIDMTMRRPDGAISSAGDPVAMMLALAAVFPRKDVERGIDAMIEALDAADGDTDSEDGDDDCCAAGDDDPHRSDKGTLGDDDCEQGTWEHHGRQPSTIVADLEDFEPDDSSARLMHRDRLRRTRCREARWGGRTYYQLTRSAAAGWEGHLL